MAFWCYQQGEKIFSFQFSKDDWKQLKLDIQQSKDKSKDLMMGCCGARAVMKISPLGTQFFAHKATTDRCHVSSAESQEHLFVKYMVSKTLFNLGWLVDIEKHGISSDGEKWIADIYAEKGAAKIAIEVQWSPQSFEETKRRQIRYERSGVRCAWLLRQSKTNLSNILIGKYARRTKNLPVFSLYKGLDSCFYINNITYYDQNKKNYHHTYFELSQFIYHLFSKDIKFVPKYRKELGISANIIKHKCWRCQKLINIVASIYYCIPIFGQMIREDTDLSITRLPKHDIDAINDSLSAQFDFSPLKSFKFKNLSCVVNSCKYCNAPIPDIFDHKTYRSSMIETPVIPARSSFDGDLDDAIGDWFIDTKEDISNNIYWQYSTQTINFNYHYDLISKGFFFNNKKPS